MAIGLVPSSRWNHVLIVHRHPLCDFTFRFPIRVHFRTVPMFIRVLLIAGSCLLIILFFAIYLKIHWRNACRLREADRKRRKEEEKESSEFSEEWAEVDRDEDDVIKEKTL